MGVEGMHMELFSARLRAISPVIAMIIVVAITLAIAFAVVGWMFGLWSGLATGSPQISITNAKVYYNKTEKVAIVELYFINEGLESDQVLKVELIKEWKTADTEASVWIEGNSKGWQTFTIDLKDKFELKGGDSVLVKVYMMKSGTLTIPVVASPAVD